MYQVQFKDGPKAKWRANRFPLRNPTLRDAVREVCALDQDGCLSPGTIRIFDLEAGAVVDPKEYTDPANPFYPRREFETAY